MTATDRALELAQVSAQAAADKLATDIKIIDVSERLAITDCFVIVTGVQRAPGRRDRRLGRGADARRRRQTHPPRR